MKDIIAIGGFSAVLAILAMFAVLIGRLEED
jgi:hypothetical protein